MLLAPVTYAAEARQVCVPCQSAAQFSERYWRPAMFPFAAQPVVAGQASVTRMRSRVGLPGISDPPQRLRYVPTPASRSNLFVIGELHVACCTRWPYGLR